MFVSTERNSGIHVHITYIHSFLLLNVFARDDTNHCRNERGKKKKDKPCPSPSDDIFTDILWRSCPSAELLYFSFLHIFHTKICSRIPYTVLLCNAQPVFKTIALSYT